MTAALAALIGGAGWSMLTAGSAATGSRSAGERAHMPRAHALGDPDASLMHAVSIGVSTSVALINRATAVRRPIEPS
jgi:hypothetical protein